MTMRIAALTIFALLFAAMTLAAEPVTPFNGKNLEGWTLGQKAKTTWVVGVSKMDEKNNAKLVLVDAKPGTTPELVNPSSGTNIYTNDKFGDATIALEVMVPKGSNSGVYVMGEYEVQVLDSWGKEKIGPGDMGGLYAASAPSKNACKKPGEWQTLEIVFEAPKFEGDKKLTNARFVKVVLNGETIHENVEMKGPTPSGVTGKEGATGPLMFQGDHGPVAYRNINITPKK
jgi:hypothetical protein